jgi:hypothetical protein
LLAFACDHAPDNTGAEATTRTLMRAIYASCAYESGSTNVSTMPRQCWPSGVACARTSRPANRAVLQPGPVGARRQRLFVRFRQLSDAIMASHVWTEVFLEGRGWDST